MEAYCVKCKSKRQVKDPVAITAANGRSMTKGVCEVCGTKVCRIGKSE